MKDSRKLAAGLAGGLLLVAGMASAQIAPLRPRPAGPVVQQPSVAPLEIVEAPSGEVLGSYIFGVSFNRSDRLMVRTRGGQGTVTLSVAVEGRNNAARLDDPPASPAAPNMTLAKPLGPNVTSAIREAAPVSRVIVIDGYGEVRRDVPSRQKVTLTARDSSGREVRREFHVRFTRAMGAPIAPDVLLSSIPGTTLAASHFTPAQAERLYDPDVPLTPFHNVQLGTRGYSLNFARLDPGSEVICVYGSFRYACEYDVVREATREELAQAIMVKVPDLGRGKRVGIVLKNEYGETAPLMVDIDTRTQAVLRRSRSFNGPVAGKQPGSAAPFYSGSPIGDNGAQRACDKPYLVWVDAKTDGKMFHDPKGPPISLKFSGPASVRVTSVPRGQVITNNIDSRWAKLEFDVPAGIIQDYLYSVELTYDTRMGECPAKRR